MVNFSDPSEAFFYYTFHYHPNNTSAAIAIGCFCLATVASLVMTVIYGGRFMYIIPATGLVEIAGYALRIVTEETKSLTPFIVSTLFLLMAPIALALVNYIVVSKLLVAADRHVKICVFSLKPKQISRVFFWSDVICFFVQAAGGGLLAIGSESMNSLGTGVVLVGLAIQLIFFGAFIWILHIISTKPDFCLKQAPSLDLVFVGLRFTVSCLLIRNIYRMVEFASGPTSVVHGTEWVFSIFETLPIFIAMMGYCFFHFGRLLDAKNSNPQWILEVEALKAHVDAKQFGASDHNEPAAAPEVV